MTAPASTPAPAATPHIPTVGGRSPWGPIQTAERIGPWLTSVTTASHGGIYVPREVLSRIPEAAQVYAESWSGSRHWYEEDCAVAYVILAFPESFSFEQHSAAVQAVTWIEQQAGKCGAR